MAVRNDVVARMQEILTEKKGGEAFITKADCELAFLSALEAIADVVYKNDDTLRTPLGTFSVKVSAARKGLNPSTKEPVEVAPRRYLKLRPAKHLNQKVTK